MSSAALRLASAVQSGAIARVDERAVASETDAVFRELAGQQAAQGTEIPQFYFPSPAAAASAAAAAASAASAASTASAASGGAGMGAMLRREARLRFLGSEIEGLAGVDELDAMWGILVGETVRLEHEGEDAPLMLDYEGYVRARERMGRKVAELLSGRAFYEFEGDAFGRVSAEVVYEYAMGRASLQKTRIMLSAHDQEGDGYLTEADMERFIYQSVQDLPCLSGLDPTFHVFYVCTAVRKFFFFLDPMRLGRISIKSLLLSPVLSEFFELEDEVESEGGGGGEVMMDGLSGAVTEGAVSGVEVGTGESGGSGGSGSGNWFTPASARRVYAEYLQLDVDHNGMLSRSELGGYGSGALTPAFLDRVFEECHTYGGEMDYKTYLDFVLAMENKHSAEALRFFFRLLDMKGEGRITAFTINYFFKDVLREMERVGYALVRMEDVKDEIFDMVSPADPLGISLKDLIRCGVGGTVVDILTSTSGFWCYDNREMLLSM